MELPERPVAKLNRLHVIMLLVMVGVAAMLAWTTWSARELVRTFVPQIEASAVARLAVTEAHLWLEEIVSGDAGEDPQQVWDRIDLARANLAALADGGGDTLATVRQLDDAGARDETTAALRVLATFEELARVRVSGALAQTAAAQTPVATEDGAAAAPDAAVTAGTGVGTDIDARFDQVFEEFISTTDRLETRLNEVVDRELATFTLIQMALIAVVVALFGTVFYLLRRKEAMEQDAHLDSLRASYAQLEHSQRELARQNKLRGALVVLGERLQGLDSPREIARVALDTLCADCGAQAGACWSNRPGTGLVRLAGHALPEERAGIVELEEGEGLVGRVALDGQPIAIDIPSDYFPISSGMGRTPAPHLRVLPLIHDGITVAVLELAFLHAPDADVATLLEAAAPAVAVRLHLVGRFDDVDEALRAAVM